MAFYGNLKKSQEGFHSHVANAVSFRYTFIMAENKPDFILMAIDPGTHKCGLAVVDGNGALLHREVCLTPALTGSVKLLMSKYVPQKIVLGDATYSDTVAERLMEAGFTEIVFFNERRLTDRARKLYFQENPPKGLRKLIPLTLQTPPVPYDDYAAWLLARDYLQTGAKGSRVQGDE